MDWQQQASQKTLDAQFNDFMKDISYILDPTFGSEILIKHGFNLDNALLETFEKNQFSYDGYPKTWQQIWFGKIRRSKEYAKIIVKLGILT